MANARIQFSLAKLLVGVAVCAGVLSLIVTCRQVYQRVVGGIRDVYLCSSAADLIIEHLDVHNGRWPKTWDDLHGTFQSTQINGYFRGFPWKDFQDRVEIDFAADPGMLAQQSLCATGAPFQVVWAKGDKMKPFPGPYHLDPNVRILGYLQSASERTTTVPQSQSGSPAGSAGGPGMVQMTEEQ